MVNWLQKELRPALRSAAGWGMVVCPLMFFLAMSGSFATDWMFITATVVGFVVSLIVWVRLGKHNVSL